MGNEFHDPEARQSIEQSRRDMRDSLIACGVVIGATILGQEAIDRFLPESAFTEAASNTVLTLGGLTTATIAAAGNISALYWRHDAKKRERIAQTGIRN